MSSQPLISRRALLRRLGVGLGALSLFGPLTDGDFVSSGVRAADGTELTPVETDLIQTLDGLRGDLVSVNQDIWTYAELGLEEFRSAARLIGVLKKAGFKVKEGVSGM